MRSLGYMAVCMLFLAAQPSAAQLFEETGESGFVFDMHGPDEDFVINLYEMNQQSFQYDFHLQIMDLDGITDDQALQDLEIRTSDGVLVQHRVRVEHDDTTYVIGSLVEDHQLRISSFETVDGVPQFTFSVTDANNVRIQDLSQLELVVFDEGRDTCFDFVPPAQANLGISVGIAIDISGSMSGFESQINRSINAFLDQVGGSALCTIMEFNHDYELRTGGRNRRVRCDSVGRFQLSRIDGGTAIFPALEEMYRIIQGQNSALELVLVVSDGASTNDRYQEALDQQGDTSTFVNWLGRYNPDYPLAQFADAEIFGTAQEDGTISEFFQAAGLAVSGQFVARQCSI